MKISNRSLARCLCIALIHASLFASHADEKTVPLKPEKPAGEKEAAKEAKPTVEETFQKFLECLVKKDEKAALSMMTGLKEMPEPYLASKLQSLMESAGLLAGMKVINSRELTEVAAVLLDKTKPNRKPNYGLMLFRKEAGLWKFADNGLFDRKRPIPSISDLSRKECDELRYWCTKLEAEARQSAK